MIRLDKTDHEILELLKADGRMPFSAIAKEIGITSTTVGQRVQRLINEELIRGFSVDLDKELLGYHVQAIISVKLHFAKIDAFNQLLKELEGVEYCFRVTGEDCLIMKVSLRNNKHLLEFINSISEYGTTTSKLIIEQLL